MGLLVEVIVYLVKTANFKLFIPWKLIFIFISLHPAVKSHYFVKS